MKIITCQAERVTLSSTIMSFDGAGESPSVSGKKRGSGERALGVVTPPAAPPSDSADRSEVGGVCEKERER